LDAVKRILRYLQGTVSHVSTFSPLLLQN
jgi:hypothetical protein